MCPGLTATGSTSHGQDSTMNESLAIALTVYGASCALWALVWTIKWFEATDKTRPSRDDVDNAHDAAACLKFAIVWPAFLVGVFVMSVRERASALREAERRQR